MIEITQKLLTKQPILQNHRGQENCKKIARKSSQESCLLIWVELGLKEDHFSLAPSPGFQQRPATRRNVAKYISQLIKSAQTLYRVFERIPCFAKKTADKSFKT